MMKPGICPPDTKQPQYAGEGTRFFQASENLAQREDKGSDVLVLSEAIRWKP